MKENIDLIAAFSGGVAAFLKAIKKRLSVKIIVISAIIGAFFGFGTIGLLSIFLDKLSTSVIVFASFAFGWVANEVTDVLEEAVKDGYDFAKAYTKARKKPSTNEDKKDENE